MVKAMSGLQVMDRYSRQPTASRYGTVDISSISSLVDGEICAEIREQGSAGMVVALQVSMLNLARIFFTKSG